MSKNTKWLIVIVAIFLGVILFFFIKHSLKVEAELSFPDTIEVQNGSDFNPDKIVKALAYNVLEIFA